MFSFEHKEFLFGLAVLLPLLLIFVAVLKWKQKVKKALGDIELIDRLTQGYSHSRFKRKFTLLIIAIAFVILAAANLRKPVAGTSEPTAGIDVIIALDVSKSMLSNDIKPSRLERAKQVVSLLIDKLGNDRVGLVVFAGHAYLQMPLTPDLEEAKMYLSNASPDAVPVQGTNIGEALELCNNSLNTREKTHKAVVLITDGEDHYNNAGKIAQQLSDDGVVVSTVGIGTTEGSPIIDPIYCDFKTDENGKTVISKLNDSELKDIASATGGNYFHMENALVTSTQVTKALDAIEKKYIAGSGEKIYFSFAPFFLSIAVMLLLIDIFTPESKSAGKQLKKHALAIEMPEKISSNI
jgi:Ca-activated chloride channel family protein